jgi:hypothetical protein
MVHGFFVNGNEDEEICKQKVGAIRESPLKEWKKFGIVI